MNGIAGRMQEEFAGSTFSPDGQTLFVNIQASSALSFAIWGPWEEGPLWEAGRTPGSASPAHRLD